MVADEVNDIVADIARVDISLNTAKRIEHRCAALVYVAIALCHIVNLVLGKTVLAHDYSVDTLSLIHI